MIGIGYVINNEYKNECFYCSEYNLDQEKTIIFKFKKFIDDIRDKVDPNHEYPIRLFHWAHVERTLLNAALIRHPSLSNMWDFNEIFWIDMCDIFTNNPIVIKDAFCFKLKEIARAMYKHNMININWDGLNDGLVAMINAINYYNNNNINYKNEEIMLDIKKYNLIDCKVLYEIINYIRNL